MNDHPEIYHRFDVLYPSADARSTGVARINLGSVFVVTKRETPAYKVILAAIEDAWIAVRGMYGHEPHAGFGGLALTHYHPDPDGQVGYVSVDDVVHRPPLAPTRSGEFESATVTYTNKVGDDELEATGFAMSVADAGEGLQCLPHDGPEANEHW